jgi:hypothetical protein
VRAKLSSPAPTPTSQKRVDSTKTEHAEMAGDINSFCEEVVKASSELLVSAGTFRKDSLTKSVELLDRSADA